MEFTPSWAMASQAVRNAFEEVLDEATQLLRETLGLTWKAAVTAVENIRQVAIEKALDRIMIMDLASNTVVQPDYLIKLAAGFLWFAACEHCEIPEEETRNHGVDFPFVMLTKPGVDPSPEHLMRIKQALEKRLSDAKVLLSEAEGQLSDFEAKLAAVLEKAQKKKDGLAEASK